MRPEVLAPVGNWEMLLAAVHNGADAVYMGMPGFNARGRAHTLNPAELGQMTGFARLYGVRVFLAFNVLIFEREIDEVIDLLAEVLPLRPDALIIQDLGLVRLIRAMAPEQVVHASTQMTVSSAEAIELTADLDIRRYVLARELSLPEIEKIRASTDKELEVFVHGALCVAYSGQCLTSESLGGRSANRGQCAQACRLEYDLFVDGSRRDLGDRRYLVSPKDLCGLDEIGELKRLGIESLKIEGRLKSPEYVAVTTRAYREAAEGDAPVSESDRFDMERTFSRGFYPGWLHGVEHQKLVDGTYSSHRGPRVGTIVKIENRRVLIATHVALHGGDGIVFADPRTGEVLGSRLYHADRGLTPDTTWLSFSNDFDLGDLHSGMDVFLNDSPGHDDQLRRTFTDKQQWKRIEISASVTGSAGRPLSVVFGDVDGNTAGGESEAPLAEAKKRPLDLETVREELSALGGTPFVLGRLDLHLDGDLFIDTREIKALRRRLSSELARLRGLPPAPPLADPQAVRAWVESERRTHRADGQVADPIRPALSVLVRDQSQIEALAGLSIDTIYLDFEFGKEYVESVQRVRELGFSAGIATTRILKPIELGHLKLIERLRPDRILVRNLGALEFLRSKNLELVGDFSLNASNSLSTSWLLEKGLTRLTPSHDLNREQLMEMVRATGGGRLEPVIHHYMPSFHMEHCVFAAFLSSGSSYRDCGRPCERHRVELKGPDGALHPLKADAECRNTMFNGNPQSAAKLVPELLESGVRRFRLEALFETPAELRSKVEAYLSLLAGASETDDVFAKLRVVERYGVTDGQLFNIRGYRDRKKDQSEVPSAVKNLVDLLRVEG